MESRLSIFFFVGENLGQNREKIGKKRLLRPKKTLGNNETRLTGVVDIGSKKG